MKKINLNPILSGLFFVALITFASCSKENNFLNEQITPVQPDLSFLETNTTLVDDISVYNGILQFNSLNDFRSSLPVLNKMNGTDHLQWEQTLGFISMQTIFNNIIQAEYDNEGSLRSDIYNAKIQSGFIVTDDATGLYKLNIFNPAYASVLDENGLVMIGSVLYQFTATTLKMWEGADINEVETLLKAAENTNAITIIPIRYEEVTLRNSSQWTDECSSTNGDAMMKLTVSYFSDFTGSAPEAIFVDYSVNILVMIPNSSGELQYDPNAIFELVGKSTTNITISDGSEEYIKTIEGLDEVTGVGGNYTFIPEVSGEYETAPPLFFVNPARLMFSWWQSSAKSSLGTNHQCEILM